MNKQQIALIQDSFAAVLPIADTAATLFWVACYRLVAEKMKEAARTAAAVPVWRQCYPSCSAPAG